MNPFDIGYIMGLITGEGSFTGDKQQPALQVKLYGDDKHPLSRLKSLLGGKIYGPYYSKDGRYSLFWILRGKELQAAVPLFYKCLPPSMKREQFILWMDRYGLEPYCEPSSPSVDFAYAEKNIAG